MAHETKHDFWLE
ncbi:unnamed protein product, partial [Rotaria magnacalcarata]